LTIDSFRTAGTLRVGDRTYAVHRIDRIAPPDLPFSFKIVLENLLRHEDGERTTAEHVLAITGWEPTTETQQEINLTPARAFLHDTNGVPVLADLAAMRAAMAAIGGEPVRVSPLIPTELVVDHSVIADSFGRPDALARNVELEYRRNHERYRFLKWGQSALRHFALVPPGTGIMHQVNLEHLARVVIAQNGQAFPDVCLGTDSHTTMVNGLGVLGWGIGGIEAEAAMLGQSLSMRMPRVVGVRLHGTLREGATATDLVLTITETLRRHGDVGKFVEFYGPGLREIAVPDRATIANMSPEFGSTCAIFPIDEETIRYLAFTGRRPEHVALVEAYAQELGLWHDPATPARYSERVELDLGSVVPSLAGPRRPQDRVPLTGSKAAFRAALDRTPARARITVDGKSEKIADGAVAVAAITSCTNTSNPAMVSAALLARNATQRGLRRKPWVKTTLSPGSRVVMDYYDKAGLTGHLEELSFHLTGYGCMTCIGASGPLIESVSNAVRADDLTVAAVLSGNRNFEGRINPDVRMNYLASPPLVVAYALAGTMDIDLYGEPLGTGHDGRPVFLADIWPSPSEVAEVIDTTIDPAMFATAYADVFAGDEKWRSLPAPAGDSFDWDENSTYLRRPPYLDGMPLEPAPVTDIRDARILVKLGDSVTTDHISPAGAITPESEAGRYLQELGVARNQLNTYASRRGNHEVMMRGTFANVRLRNQLVPGAEGGYTRDPLADDRIITVYQAAMSYRAASVPTIVVAGEEYGCGASRDWAAKGPALLGVRAVLAESFERIHRSNLIGMGILPLQFLDGDTADALGITGEQPLTITGLTALNHGSTPERVTVHIGRVTFDVKVRLDTAREAAYYRHGGIMKYVLRTVLAES
jgi:aconitate hydratase